VCVLQDHEELYGMGVAAIYGPGTRIPAAALDMIQLLMGGDEDDPQQQQQQQATAGAQGTASS
jgi:methylmalonyl-CoA mutase cobalamin-binding subunit